MDRIFVAIASYRDVQCQHTVKSLFEKAKHPERITVGICWQIDPKEDNDCFAVPSPYPDQMRVKSYHWKASKGGCWARNEALTLLQDEEYILQIDAHMLFVEGWDELMLKNLRECPSKKAALSTILPGYEPPDKFWDFPEIVWAAYPWRLIAPNELQPISLSCNHKNRYKLNITRPLISPFFVGNFLFAPAEMVREIPFDPHIYFRGQEAVYSARIWTHGWDIYMPYDTILFHYWDSVARRNADAPDYKKTNEASLLAKQRVWHLLGVEKARDSNALVEIEKYGMGKARPLAHFWKFADIDLKTGYIGEMAKNSDWKPYQG